MGRLTKCLSCFNGAATLGEAEDALDALEAKWGDRYPIVIKSWCGKWELLSAYFRYPEPTRRTMYTTNAVEQCIVSFVN